MQTHRPVRRYVTTYRFELERTSIVISKKIYWFRRHGKLLEEGASGFLQKKLAEDRSKDNGTEHSEVDWGSVNNIFSEGASDGSASFGSKHWASVYLASTPQQAAEMGLQFPGVDEVPTSHTHTPIFLYFC